MNTNKTTPRYFIVELLKTKYKVTILNPARKNGALASEEQQYGYG